MRSNRWITTLRAAGIAAAAALAVSCTAARDGGADKARADRIERGRRLTYIGACHDCHTPGTFYGAPDATRELSGSEVGWEGPWGVSYPRNLTPDMETGIGSWSEEDIVTAIRTGARPDGSRLLPPMPWPWYANLTDEEAYAIAAYLKSLPPIRHSVPTKTLPGVVASGARFTLPTAPEWDGRNVPASTAATATPSPAAN